MQSFLKEIFNIYSPDILSYAAIIIKQLEEECYFGLDYKARFSCSF
jgi:hypothetical protein